MGRFQELHHDPVGKALFSLLARVDIKIYNIASVSFTQDP
jgi:hypothetical protein